MDVWQEYYWPATLTYCQVDSGEKVCGPNDDNLQLEDVP